jgi:ectoine hydroxylase-related dioxygenase (phytanoyl-CoA dioxygenase family)
MPNYLRTYDELSDSIKLSRTHLEKNINKKLFLNISCDEVMYIIGCKFFDVDLYYPNINFKSNRYFLDAIGMNLLPNVERIKELENYIFSRPALDLEINNIYKSVVNSIESVSQSSTTINFESYLKNGYLILENIIDTDVCNQLSDLINHHTNFERYSSKGGYIYGDGNMQRVYNLVTKENQFRQLLENSIIHDVMRKIFHRDTFHSKYYLTSFHANVLAPEASPQIWHIDANVPEPLPDWNIRANVNFLVQDYTGSNGATEVIPGSHRWLRKPTLKEANSLNPSSITIEAPKGSAIVWHGYLWHRSGQNTTKSSRIALLSTYAAGFLREVSLEENVFLSSNPSIQNLFSSKLKRILGWSHGLKEYGG